MRIATWNVNSIRTRLTRLIAWLGAHSPDALCLQEIKTTAEEFPFAELAAAGYSAAIHGQKTYNGVAILAKSAPTAVRCGFEDGEADDQARFITATVGGVRLASAYFPNGQEVGSDKYAYKLRWLDRLSAWLRANARPDEPLAVCGDFNIATDDRDVKNPEKWEGSVLFNDELREKLAAIRAFGFVDALRAKAKEGGVYTWWDYRELAFPKNDGLRIDYVYLTQPLGRRLLAASVDRDQRKPTACPEGTKPSDHAPVVVDVDFGAPGAGKA